MNRQISFPMFGDKIVIGFEDMNDFALETYKEEIVTEALRLQKLFNFYDKASELSKLNKDREIRASDELLFVLNTALDYCEMSNGAYDISKGKNFLERKRGDEVKELSCSYKDILIDGDLVRLNHPDVIVDLGSIAKGYIVDRLREYIKDFGFDDFYIDARGDLSFTNYSANMEVQDPRADGIVSEIDIKNGCVATSGDYLQYNHSFDESHILNNIDYSSVTVIHDSLMIADVLATTISVAGKGFVEANDLISHIPMLILSKKGEVAYNTLEVTV